MSVCLSHSVPPPALCMRPDQSPGASGGSRVARTSTARPAASSEAGASPQGPFLPRAETRNSQAPVSLGRGGPRAQTRADSHTRDAPLATGLWPHAQAAPGLVQTPKYCEMSQKPLRSSAPRPPWVTPGDAAVPGPGSRVPASPRRGALPRVLPASCERVDALRVFTRTGRLAPARSLTSSASREACGVFLFWRMIWGVSNHFSERIWGFSVKSYDSNSFPLTELKIRKAIASLVITQTSSLSSSK